MKTKLIIGFNEKVMTDTEIRNVQKDLLNNTIGANDIAIIDAIISHFINGRKTEWK